MSTTIQVVCDNDTRFTIRKPDVNAFSHMMLLRDETGGYVNFYFTDDSFENFKREVNREA